MTRETAAAPPRRYAVFGQPIAHSLSPRIHALFGAQLGIAIDYRAIEAGPDDFAARLGAFAHEGGVGANVTLPLKEQAFALCDAVSDRARRAGSVNTLLRDGDRWRGDSTDGAGFLRDLVDHVRFDPRERRVLLLGAGGAARAVAFALADVARAIVIANRTPARAEALARDLGPRAEAIAWHDVATVDAVDLVVNATSAGHRGTFALPLESLAPSTVCYDLSYGAAAVPFLDWARRTGSARVADGFGMLIEQAAESFALWHERTPDTHPGRLALMR